MKSHMIQCLLALSALCALKMTAQVVPFTNIQQQVVFGIVEGSTPNDPNFYQWQQLSTTLQGVAIALEPTEVSTLFLEENNCKLQFSNFQFMTLLEASFDNAAFTTLHQGQSRQHVGWIDPPSSFLTLGTHKLKIRFQPGSSSNLLNREYNIVVVPAPETMFGDNTQANAPNGNQLTTGNILALYDNPTCSNAEPVLLAEGYDASNTTFPEFYRFAGDDLIKRLFDNGYKVYILNFNLANQDLRNNAAVYNSAIRFISSINGNKDVTASGAAWAV